MGEQAPQEMLTSACMLADIFPAEWPPPGAAGRAAGSCHLPPAHMPYRASLACSVEPATAALRRLLAAAAGSEALLFRAALVRLCARGSGLGGGMGAFMVGPLMQELTNAAQPSKDFAEARRCLEVLVPLAYRPAMKVRRTSRGHRCNCIFACDSALPPFVTVTDCPKGQGLFEHAFAPRSSSEAVCVWVACLGGSAGRRVCSGAGTAAGATGAGGGRPGQGGGGACADDHGAGDCNGAVQPRCVPGPLPEPRAARCGGVRGRQ